MDYKKINITILESVAIIQLNSPLNYNALDGEMLDELIGALNELADENMVRVLVIEGVGPSFSAGGDIKVMIKAINEESPFIADGLRKLGVLAMLLRSFRKPIIASVHGAVAGAGFNMALLCDFRVASQDTKFIQAFINIGLVPDMGGTLLLTRMIGVARATELIMTGRPVEASEALSLGLVNQVVPIELLKEATIKLANKLSHLPEVALGNMKALINLAELQDLEIVLNKEAEYQLQCAQTDDFKEGIQAFAEKRKPIFNGRRR